MAVSADINTTFGAILLGSLFAALLSGMVTAQAVVYRKLYPKDSMKVKSLRGGTSSDIWGTSKERLTGYTDHHHVHEKFEALIFNAVSRKNYYIAGPIFALAALRLMTTGTMVYYGTFSAFKAHFFGKWVFSLGLALSSIVDIAITVSLFVLLYRSRNGMPHLNAVIDSLILYAFENGSLTCIATVVSMICWVAMNDNFIFLGLHFAIGKLYANTFLATLNARFIVRDGRTTSSSGPVIVLESRRQPPSGQRQEESTTNGTFGIASKVGPVKINVEQTIHYDNDREYDVERK
ncbi:uncharacterized protein SCHCODRAFT_0235791 [Schizophyllum commune H4-8]|uniref:DUF6534 domain-containing protein n=1 Tax=Schizophyllum commune (strain H4-8 / FGSC 9210) TaxID=578458 RepID=D8Q8M3_SCHCM|nr:uncharacterized protein SCHCODRAFT_0235791 [Schizophyllum commune H4-8]KAI5890757.1 hypothetical protein SCHCODRAFT_0235791 [Schizophyllum commune H4-8]